MAIAAARTATPRRIVAVIGDGAMSAGIAFEALNHIGSMDLDILVVLNDNDMSISEATGAFSNYLARLLSGERCTTIRKGSVRMLQDAPAAPASAWCSESLVRETARVLTLFDDMGLHYVGPIDGHNVGGLVATLKNLRETRGPQLLHVVTTKGKGYAPAEADPITWHGPGPFDARTGVAIKENSVGPTYTQVFAQSVIDCAQRDERVVAITPAMREGSGLGEFSSRFPLRYFDVGIAEQHALTVAAGMACDGLKPVVAIYSTFLQRAYDQLIHDVALQNLPVVFAIDRAGPVGGDGATHRSINRREILAVRWISPAARNPRWSAIRPRDLRRGSSSSGSASGENTALHFSLCNRSYHFEHSADSGLPRCSLHCRPQIAGRQALSAGADARTIVPVQSSLRRLRQD